MSTKFDSLFAGHVDMEDVGYGGVPVNDRRLPNEHLASVFGKCEAEQLERFATEVMPAFAKAKVAEPAMAN